MAARHNLSRIQLHLVEDRVVVTLTRRGISAGEQTAHWACVPSGDTFVCVAPSGGAIAAEAGIDALQRFLIRAFSAGAKTPSNAPMTFASEDMDVMLERYLDIKRAPKPAAAEEKKRKPEEAMPEKPEEKKSKEEKDPTQEPLSSGEANKVLNKFKLPLSGLQQLDLNESGWKKLSNKEKLPLLRRLVGKFTQELREAADAAHITKTVTLTALIAALEAKQ